MLDPTIRPNQISPIGKVKPAAAEKIEKTNNNDQQKQNRRQTNKEDEDERVGVNIDEHC